MRGIEPMRLWDLGGTKNKLSRHYEQGHATISRRRVEFTLITTILLWPMQFEFQFQFGKNLKSFPFLS